MTQQYDFDWSELAFGSKKPLRSLKAVFIAAPRELSSPRFAQLVKRYIGTHDIVLGLAKEPFVSGFDGQPQFKTLQSEAVRQIIQKVNSANLGHKVYTLSYYQRETPYVLEKLAFSRAVFVNGSWRHSFHVGEAFYTLVRLGILYELVSPFTDEAEAEAYAERTVLPPPALPAGHITEAAMFELAYEAAAQSFDYAFQTGVAAGVRHGTSYEAVATAFNKVVPYQTHAMHFGASRERHLSPPNDLNYYDTVHAETGLLLTAVREKLSLDGVSLFINLLPCPPCARMLADSPVAEVVYRRDHSEGYAVALLIKAGKTVRRATWL